MELIKKEATFNKPTARRGTQCNENVGVMEGFSEEMPNGLRAAAGEVTKQRKEGTVVQETEIAGAKAPW